VHVRIVEVADALKDLQFDLPSGLPQIPPGQLNLGGFKNVSAVSSFYFTLPLINTLKFLSNNQARFLFILHAGTICS